ncbi:MAG: TIGR03936 family radical SAM-associated protein [Clostridiales bacterium]|nr:TIGR03936 family radical SAM-associated protein [Clostridiales bacterium]
MKNIRVKYIKEGKAKYISHLDMNRCMTRCLVGSRIPLWHTEGFNPHVFITFALPLSLGYTGLAEYMDMRLLDEDMPYDEIKTRMNKHLPQGIRVTDVYDLEMDPKQIDSALFELDFPAAENDIGKLETDIKKLLSQDKIIVQKKSKSGMKDIDLKQYILSCEWECDKSGLKMTLVLPAGNTTNINPSLLLSAIENEHANEIFCLVTRKELYCKDGSIFR